ncbi:MAG: PRC-barrel domain protein [Frankiales bacterium]|nr:PRC-barrel domain protein [Frankiales bacterium]
MELPEQAEAKHWEGASVVDPDGAPLGRCTGVFADVDTGATEWVTVAVDEHRRLFVPALGASATGGTLKLRFSRADVLAAPRVGDDQELSKGDEVRLYEHYRVEHTSASSGSVLPTAAASGSPTGVSPVVDDDQADVPPSSQRIDDLDDEATPATVGLALPEESLPEESLPEEPLPATEAPATPAPSAPPVEALIVPTAPVVPDRPQAPVAAPAPAQPSAPPEPPRPAGRPALVPSSPAASTGSSAAPLAVVAGIVAAAGIALQVWELRARRRRRPAARAARARKQAKLGSAAAVSSAARHLTEVASVATDTASRTTRQLSDAASAASATAAKSSASVTSTVTAIPPAVARRGRKARRSVARTLWDAATVGTAGTGYVLGAKAGRGRYEQINQQAQELASSPQVKALTDAVKDTAGGRSSRR